MFYEECNHPVKNSGSDYFKNNFILHIYDEYEDDCLDIVPKKEAENFVNFGQVSEENLIAIHDQKDENLVDSECGESDYVPLCYSSFELLR